MSWVEEVNELDEVDELIQNWRRTRQFIYDSQILAYQSMAIPVIIKDILGRVIPGKDRVSPERSCRPRFWAVPTRSQNNTANLTNRQSSELQAPTK